MGARLKPIVRTFIALAMVAVGIAHFSSPEPFVRIVPSFLPAPRMLVLISGAFEIAGGLGLLGTRPAYGPLGGSFLSTSRFSPANINMAVGEIQLEPGGTMPLWAMWARLPLQALFIAAAWWVGRPATRS